MKKIVFILIAVTMLFTACNSNSPSSAKHDFRDIDFGMSTIELSEIEGEPDNEITGDNLTTYYYSNKEVFGVKNAVIEYSIYENGVGGVCAKFQNEYADNKSYITEYNTVKKNLISAWGEPEKITEDEAEFNFQCSWDSGKKQLNLNKNSTENIMFRVEVYSSDYLEYTHNLLIKIQQERQQSDTE